MSKLVKFKKMLLKAVGDAGMVYDAKKEEWITTSNGARVLLGEGGEVKGGMGGKFNGENIKEAGKAGGETKEPKQTKTVEKPAGVAGYSAARHGSQAKTPSGIDKNNLEQRDRNAISNTGKLTTRAAAERTALAQKYHTNVLQGEGGQFWVPATNREESILKRLGYSEAK